MRGVDASHLEVLDENRGISKGPSTRLDELISSVV